MKSDEPTSPSLFTFYRQVAALHRVSRDIFVTARSSTRLSGWPSQQLTAEEPKNLSAASGAAYKTLGAIFPRLVAPNPALKLLLLVKEALDAP